MFKHGEKSVILTLAVSQKVSQYPIIPGVASIDLPQCSPLLLQPRSPKMDCRIDPERGEEKKEEEREREREPRLLLLTNVENAAELRSMALATSGLALAKAALLPDLLQGK